MRRVGIEMTDMQTPMHSDPDAASEQRQPMSDRRRGAAMLAGFAAAVIVIWGAVLPRIARMPAMRRSIETTERLGINPAAIYYSDLYPRDAARRIGVPIGRPASNTMTSR